MAGQANVTIRDKLWNVSMATTPWELEQGLGGLAELPAGTGMLFDLGMEQTIQVTTVPMLFSLDIVFLSEALVITEIYRNIQPGYLVNSISSARFFLEVNAGETEGIESGDQVSVEMLSGQESGSSPDWVPAFISFMGIIVMGIFSVSIVRDLVKGLFGEPKQPELLPQTKLIGRFIIRMDRVGNIIITHSKHPGRSVFLQFESDKDLVKDLLRKSERTELDKGWNIEIKDIEPRASILNELWETSSVQDMLAQNSAVSGLADKWRKAKVRNSALALKDLESLCSGYDTDDCKQALLDYREIEPSDYGDREEYQEARDEAWNEFLESLESLAGEEEETENRDKIEVVIVDRGPRHKLVKIYKRGRVYAATYAEPFPTKESALADYLRNPRKFQPFDESSMTYLPAVEENHNTENKPAVLPIKYPPQKRSELKYLADSPEFLTQTIEDIGYRNRIDSAFQEAIIRVRQGK